MPADLLSIAKKIKFLGPAACLILIIAMPITAQSQGFEWVVPGEYEFGSCRGYGGETAPSGHRNEKYYSRYQCNKAYFEEDRCYLTGITLQRQMSPQALQECGSWLVSEVKSCQRYVNQAGQKCAQLAK